MVHYPGEVFVLFKRMSKISQEYDALLACDIQIPPFELSNIPQFSQLEVKKKLLATKTNKASPSGDVPPKIIKMCAEQISVPLTKIINSSISSGIWPDSWKIESVTPVPKVHPPNFFKDLRNISGLVIFNKIQEKLITELILSDMKTTLDPSMKINQECIFNITLLT